MREERTFCRLCFGFCGMKASIDAEGRVVAVRPDHDNPLTQGYACVKGLDAPKMLYSDKRILRPLKRVGDRHVEIGLEQALDEIADRMKTIVAEDGPQSLAFFRGTGTFGSNVAIFSWPGLAESLGAQKFSTMTIDQSAKWVTAERLGTWEAGQQPFLSSDVWLFAGSNPLVSVFSWEMPAQNPMKHLKAMRARGMKLVVVDPRRTELANFADVHLQLLPGEDAAVAAGLIHVMLREGWEDREFCEANVAGMAELRTAVAPFTPEAVAERAGIAADDLVRAARVFAREGARGGVGTGTGVDMAAFPNLAEHLYQSMQVICGRFLRAGDRLPTPGVLVAKQAPRAQAVSPARTFERTPRSRVRGAVRLMGESATPTLAEEILAPGPGRVRALLISGANPASAIPDSEKVVRAMRALDLMVVVEPFHTETTRLADYVLPPRFLYEHADLTFGLEMSNLEVPYCQYTAPVSTPPADSELADEGYIAWALAKRMGATLTYFGTPLPMDRAPADDDFLAILASRGQLPYDEIKRQAVGGHIFEGLPVPTVLPADATAGRFEVMPPDVAAELAAYAAADGKPDAEFPLRLICRRIREVSNTSCRDFPSARARAPFNPLCAHPDDIAALGLADGADCWVTSDNGRIPAIVRADATLKRGVVSMTHGFGGLAGEAVDYRERGSSTSLLISLDRDCEPLQAMPRMSGVPVRVESAAL